MCWTCFKEYTDKPVVNARSQAAYDLIHNAPGEPSFGFLHSIVGDMNVDDWIFTLRGRDNEWRAEAYTEAEQWERDIFDWLAKMTEAERATAVAMEWGYISRDGVLRPDIA